MSNIAAAASLVSHLRADITALLTFPSPDNGPAPRASKPADDQNFQVLGRYEILGPDFDRAVRYRLDVVSAEADQPVRLLLVDDHVEILDGAGPIGAGLQDIADAALSHLGGVRLLASRKLVEVGEECIVHAILVAITLDLGCETGALTQAFAKNGVEADAE